jgi:membrane dipeptidase
MSVDDWVGVVDRAIQAAGKTTWRWARISTGAALPKGFRDVRDLPLITEAMLRTSYSQTRIEKFPGGNLLRVFRTVTSKHGGTL